MLVDEVTIRVEAGRGGDGAVAFNTVRLSLGPTGGDGGRGGSIYFEGVSDIGALGFFANKKVLRAENGGNGRGQFIDGKSGSDLILRIPTGTSVINTATGFTREINAIGERILAAGGGRGGRGNFKFRSSTNTTPKEREQGFPGDSVEYHLKLRLIADVGIVGLPNAGKSTLLNELTNAKSKVGAYAFTTLEPHLGSYCGLIIADIPGIIEGASQGKGLGVKFLKHIERTRVLFHLVSADSDDPLRDYGVVRAELASYNPELTHKKEYVLLTKTDTVPQATLAQHLACFRERGIEAMPISVLEPERMRRVCELLNALKNV